MTRDEMIQLLVLDRLEYRDDHARYLHMQKVLENGFCGFRKLSDKALALEIKRLGLGAQDQASDRGENRGEYCDEASDDFSDDYLFDSSLAVGHVFSVNQSSDFSQ